MSAVRARVRLLRSLCVVTLHTSASAIRACVRSLRGAICGLAPVGTATPLHATTGRCNYWTMPNQQAQARGRCSSKGSERHAMGQWGCTSCRGICR